MAKYCEACSALSPEGSKASNSRRVRNVLVGDRIVHLCEVHADVVLKEDLSSVTELRAVLRETTGKRSLVDRRSLLDRRAFPPRPEGRRQAAGRRTSDGSR